MTSHRVTVWGGALVLLAVVTGMAAAQEPQPPKASDQSAPPAARKEKDRVLFGTDLDVDKGMYRHWWRLLESSDEYMPGPTWWRLYGLELPASVLQPLYRDNARKIMNWTRV